MSELLPEGWIEIEFGKLNTYHSANVEPLKHSAEIFELYSVPVFPTGKPEYLIGSEIGSTKQSVSKNDVLLCKINPRINRVWSVEQDSKYRQIASSEWIVFRQPLIISQFMKLQLSEYSFRELLCADVTGVGGSLTRAQPKNVATFKINLPPLAEQQEIATRLDALLAQVDTIKVRLDAIPAILKRFRQAVLAAAVSGKLTEDWRESSSYSDGYPDYWEKCKLSDVGSLARGKSKHRPRNDNRLFGETYPFIQTGEIANSDGYIRESSKFYSEFGLAQSKLFPVGTLCITIAANIADTAILKIAACFPDSVVGFISNEKTCVVEFIKYLIDANKENLETFAPATAQKNINLKVLNELLLPIPPLPEQTEIVNRVEQLFTFADQIEQQVQTAQSRVDHLAQAILAKAFKGELTADWRAAHPELISGAYSAEALLEKIKATQIPNKPKRGKAVNSTLPLNIKT